MRFKVTPFTAGKIDGLADRKRRHPFAAGSQAAADYAKGLAHGRKIRAEIESRGVKRCESAPVRPRVFTKPVKY